ncbi:MAG TPA: hypothetical protein VK559_04785, partial [Ferruginibacter sp.]|nr:hypothetical protein [Ferruginibacter sp.]
MKNKAVIFVISLLLSFKCFSQTSGNDSFNIYVFQNRYTNDDYFRQHSVFKFYQFLNQGTIDPNKKSEINEKSIQTALARLYPNNDDQGFLSVDLENDTFNNLRLYTPGDPRFNNSIEQFAKLISIIKSFRPNVKVGIYGLPYRIYYPGQNVQNENQKLDRVLSLYDFISPSLYILYPDKEKGSNANVNYLKLNLQTALEYGKRLNKPVIPFVWYVVAPTNKLYGGEIIDKDQMLSYIATIKNFSWQNQKPKGVIWWEASDKGFKNMVKLPKRLKTNDTSSIKNIIIYDYTKPLIDNKN